MPLAGRGCCCSTPPLRWDRIFSPASATAGDDADDRRLLVNRVGFCSYRQVSLWNCHLYIHYRSAVVMNINCVAFYRVLIEILAKLFVSGRSVDIIVYVSMQDAISSTNGGGSAVFSLTLPWSSSHHMIRLLFWCVIVRMNVLDVQSSFDTVHVCMYIVGSHDGCLLSQSEFYIELLKSLILEGQPSQTGILLKLREGGRVSNLTYDYILLYKYFLYTYIIHTYIHTFYLENKMLICLNKKTYA